MRFPWQRRADASETSRHAAERRLLSTRQDWPRVIAVNEELQRHRELNGWTGIADQLFANRREVRRASDQ